MTKERDNSLDCLCGLLIIYMIMGHVVSLTSHVSPSETVNIAFQYSSVFFFWYMPWFFFKSGMFHKEEDWKTVFAKSSKRLLRPWLEWTILGLIVGLLIALFNGSITQYIYSNFHGLLVAGAISDNAPLWFLLSLFVVRITYSGLRQLRVNPWIIALCGVSIGFVLSGIPGFKPYYVANVFLALFFYSLGNSIGRKQFIAENKWLALMCIPVALVYYGWPSFVDFRTNNLLKGYYLIYCILSLCAIVGWNVLFKITGRIKPSGGGKFLLLSDKEVCFTFAPIGLYWRY